jgi:hypothetical protein
MNRHSHHISVEGCIRQEKGIIAVDKGRIFLTVFALIQWGIGDIESMKIASSAGVETLLNCGPSFVWIM